VKTNITRNIWSGAKRLLLITSAFCLLHSALPPAQAQSAKALNGWQQLTWQEHAQYGWTHRGEFDFTNFVNSVTNAANSAYNTIFPTPLDGTANFADGLRIRNAAIHITSALNCGSAAASYALNFGDCTTTNRIFSALAVGTNIGDGTRWTNTSTGFIGYNAGAGGTWYVGGNTNFVYNTPTNLSIWLLGPNENTNITHGRFEIYLDAVELGKQNP